MADDRCPVDGWHMSKATEDACTACTWRPFVTSYIATRLTYCVPHETFGHDDGRGWADCEFRQLFYAETTWYCGAFMSDGYRCTRPYGHSGDHQANHSLPVQGEPQ